LSGSSTTPEVSATIIIRYGDADTARSILEAISTDNLRAPPGVSVEASAEVRALRVSVSCSRGVGSLISTVDDLLSCVQAAERAIEGVAD
jgi:hypothetical protein